MSRDDSRLVVVLGELADLGRRISERAAELAGLVGEVDSGAPPDLVDRLADVRTSTADLAAAAAEVTAAAETPAAAVRDAATDTRQKAAQARDTRRARRAVTSRRQPQRQSHRSSRITAAPRPAAPDGRRRLRPLMPAVVSAAVNVAVILALAVIFIAADAKPKRPLLTLAASEENFVDEMTAVELQAMDEAAAGVDETADLLPELDVPAADAGGIDAVSLETEAFTADSAAVMPASFSADDMLADVGGTGGSGDAAPGSSRGGGQAGGGPPGAAAFFGRAGQGQSVCFICDNSSSYRDGGFHTVLDELARAVDSLRPEQSFFVVFFSDDAYPMFHPDPVAALQPATPDNKQRLRAWLATVEMCTGGQGIDEAVKIAGALDADVVYFLSDGEHAPSVVDRIASADFGGAVVHTFGMQQGVLDRRTGQIDPDKLQRQQGFDRNLVAIATAHGGGFTPVMVPPQAAMLERLRPIPKNRTPGPVWGTKL